MLDEFAAVEPDGAKVLKATRDATKRRVFNSTHQGAATSFYRIGLTNIPKLIMHWSVHQEKNQGLYYSINDKIIKLDDWAGEVEVDGNIHQYPDAYPYIKDGKLRSPWYDNECARAEHPMEIAQELDIDPFSSDFQFFDPAMIAEVEKEHVLKPYATGEVEYDEDSMEPMGFVNGVNGPLRLWIYPDYRNKIDRNIEIGAGADIAAGTGASNSTATFVNLRTGEKIAEYANPWVKPELYAHVMTALCRYFNDAFLVFDASGPTGQVFSQEIMRLGYSNIYYRRDDEGIKHKVSDKPGVFLNTKPRARLLGAYRRCLKDRTFIQRSLEANNECLEYIQKTSEEIIHSSAANSVDPSGAGMSHGDRVIADCCAVKALMFMNKMVKKGEGGNRGTPPAESYAGRKLAEELNQSRESDW
jgi:hypothetical protein